MHEIGQDGAARRGGKEDRTDMVYESQIHSNTLREILCVTRLRSTLVKLQCADTWCFSIAEPVLDQVQESDGLES